MQEAMVSICSKTLKENIREYLQDILPYSWVELLSTRLKDWDASLKIAKHLRPPTYLHRNHVFVGCILYDRKLKEHGTRNFVTKG